MADISKITLPSGQTYNIKDDVARAAIAKGLVIRVVDTLPDASADTMGALYLVPAPGSEEKNVKDEYVTYQPTTTTYEWEKIGTTEIDLSDYAKKGDGVTVTLNNSVSGTGVSAHSVTDNGHTHTVSGTGTASNVSFTGTSKDNVLGEGTNFSVSASGNVTVGTSTQRMKATASGTAVGANGTAAAITGFGAHSTENFVKSVSPSSSKLVTTTVTGVSGSTTASKVTAAARTASKATAGTAISVAKAGTAKDVAKAGTAITVGDGTVTDSTTNSDILKNISVTNETLSFGACTLDTTSVTPAVSNGTIVPAVSNGTITPYTFDDVNCSEVTANNNVTVPKAATAATTVATGSVDADGTGSSIVTGVTVGDSAEAITALGTPTTANALTGVKVTTQPTITLASSTTSTDFGITIPTGSGTASVSGSATADNSDIVNAVTGLGTATAAGQSFSGTAANSKTDVTIANHTVTQGTVSGSASGTIDK